MERIRKMFRPLAAALVLSGCAAPVHPPGTQSFHARIAGCYRLRPGPWRTDAGLARFFALDRIPPLLQLDTARLPGWEPLQSDTTPLLVARAFTAPGVRDDAFTSWRRIRRQSDSVIVGTPMPLGGVRMTLRSDGADLIGRITASTDAIPPDGVTEVSAPIRVQRTSCSSAGLRTGR